MTTKTVQYPIVGMHYRPPATDLVKAMPVGTRLILCHEPFNEHDSNAIAVHMDIDSGRRSPKVEQILARWDDSWITRESIQIGYLPKDVAAYLRRSGFPHGGEIHATFYYTFGSNVPHAKFEFERTDNG